MRRMLIILLMLCTSRVTAEPLRIAVAANFRATLEQINQQFEHNSDQQILLSSASTGVLYSQIRHGAPFHLFFAADESSPQQLLASGTGSESFCYATGALALAGASPELGQLSDPKRSVAIANPATAPYGRAAMEVLQREEFSAGKGRKLVRGNNVVQAYQFLISGAVDLALVAKSLAADSAVEVPQQWHQTLHQEALVLRPHPALDAYLNWVRSDTVRSMILDAGYRSCP